MQNELKNKVVLLLSVISLLLPLKLVSQLRFLDDRAELSGTVTAQCAVYATNQAFNRLKPFAWRISANPRIQMKDLDIPIDILVGNYQSAYRQSFDKIGLSPKYKDILTVHLGFRNVSFSPLTLGGKTMLGGGFELNYKHFRAGFMGGRFDKAIQYDSLAPGLPVFKRSGYAFRLGYGSKTDYIDLIFLKGKDNTGSLGYVPANKPVTPAENAVIGLSIRQKFFRDFYLAFDAALSAYSRDVNSSEVEDPNLFAAKLMKPFITIRTSNQYVTGLIGKLEYRQKHYKVAFEYDRIEPGFQSMGLFYMRNDFQKVAITGNFNAMKQKLFGVARLGWLWNDVLKDRVSKNLQNNCGIDLNYLYNPDWTFSFSYSNYHTKQKLEMPGQNDSIILNQPMNNFSIGATRRLKTNDLTHTFNGMLAFQNSRNRANEASPLIMQSFNVQMRYRVEMNESKLFISPAFVFTNYKFTAISTQRYNPSIIAGKSFLDQKLMAYLNTGFTFTRSGGANAGSIFRNIISASYKVYKKQMLSLRMTFSNNLAGSSGSPKFFEFQGELIYTASL